MKKFSLIFSMVVFGTFWVSQQSINNTVTRSPQSVHNTKNECNEIALGFGVQNEMRLPPATLYHYGKPEVLAKDVRANQVPVRDWNVYIMGPKSRFILNPYRKGLYGTDMPEDANKFSDAEYSALMAIKIKEECLVPSRVSSVIALATQTRFKDWFDEKDRGISVQEWSKQCYQTDGRPVENQFRFYQTRDAVAENHVETLCEKFVNQFWKDTRMAIVHDPAVSRSWAIRDRNCIEGIEGSAEYWVKAFSEDPRLWENSCDRHVTHHARARVWFRALSEKLEVLPSDFSLKAFLKGINGPETHGASDFSAADFASEFDDALARCRKSQSLDKFKQKMKSVSRELEGLMSKEMADQFKALCP